MTRFDYIEALGKALEGLPPDVVARTLADYEKRIFDASAAGQSEEEIMASLEDPQQVADRLRAPLAPRVPAVVTVPPPHAAAANAGSASVLRTAFSFVGLMVFNLFLIIPAIAYAGLLIAAFAVSLTCYVGGIAVTGASVAGVNQISLAEPFHRAYLDKPDAIVDTRGHDSRTVVNIGEAGIHVEPQAASGNAVAAANSGTASAAGSASATPPGDHGTTVDIGPQGTVLKDGESGDAKSIRDDDDVDIDRRTVSLGTDFISESRPVQVSVGIGIILAGIVGFLLCLVIARYTLAGVARLAQLEFGVLRDA